MLFLQKNIKIFERWGLRPYTPVPPAAGGFVPRPQPTVAGAPPPDPHISPLIANFWLRTCKELCSQVAMTRKWAPQTRYMLGRNAANTMEDLI